MSTPPDPITGRCMCGAVTYTVDGPPAMDAVACHCIDCQRQTGSAYTVVVAVPADKLTLNGDTLATYATTGGDHGQPTRRTFCSACGSPIVTHGAYEGLAFIKVGTLDDPSWATPAIEIWRGSAPPWTPAFPGTQVHERDPVGL